MNIAQKGLKKKIKSNRPNHKSNQPSKKQNSQHTNNPEDNNILELLRQQDARGVELLIEKYQDKLFAVVNRICGNPADSEEVLQDVFMIAFEKIDHFEQRSSLSTWLYRIAVNGALMKLRRQRHKYATVSMEDVGEAVMGESDMSRVNELHQSPADKLMQKELFSQLAESASSLPEIYQEVFYCRDVQGYSIKETGEMLHATPAAIKSRLHRSRLFIKEGLKPYFNDN